MKRYKKIIYIFLLWTHTSYGVACYVICYYGGCCQWGCDLTIGYAMLKQKKTLKDRLEDYRDAVVANRKQTENQTLIIKQEVLAYTRLLERMKIETEQLYKAQHIVKKIKNTTLVRSTNKEVK